MPSWGNACETILSPYRHFERKREIFFRSRSSRRCEDSGISAPKPSPQGEGKEEAATPQKRKPTPPRCARQPLPREGARVDTPSFLWKGRYEKERGNASQVDDIREHPIHRWRGPPSPRGKAMIREHRYRRTQPSLMGKAKRCDALRRFLKTAMPEGGISVPSHQSLPIPNP